MRQSATWLPPSLCGCQLNITAEWADPNDIVNGQAYRHPIPFSVSDVQIVNCCQRHQPVANGAMPDTAHLFETDPITGEQFQQRGYLAHPIENPTPAQVLYHYLCGHKGQTQKFPCGCAAHMWGDFSGNYTYAVKPGVTQKCLKHKNDTIDMQQAAADFRAMVAASKG